MTERENNVLFSTYERLKIGAVQRASGVYITTDRGTYLDALAGLGVNALGHSHPAVVKAVQEQAAKYMHLSNLYLQEPQIELAEKLKRASGWERVFFCNTGTEAVEGAIKLARKYFHSEAKSQVLGIANGFHGRTYGPLSIMDKVKYREGFGPFLPEAGDISGYESVALEEKISARTAAVFIEPIQGEGGIIEIPEEFVATLNALRERHEFLIVADEIQSGIGRTGTFFAYEHYGLKPDIVLCAKAIGGGLPLGAILSSKEVSSAFTPGVHGTTFGGNALACAAGSVVLDLVEKKYMDQAAHEGSHMMQSFESLRERYPDRIKEVRGKGLMIGVEFFSGAKDVQQDLLDANIIANVTGGEVLRLLPPLIFEREHSDRVIDAVEDSLRGKTKESVEALSEPEQVPQ